MVLWQENVIKVLNLVPNLIVLWKKYLFGQYYLLFNINIVPLYIIVFYTYYPFYNLDYIRSGKVVLYFLDQSFIY